MTLETIDTMSGRTLRIVEAAVPEFKRRVAVGLEEYEISVHDTKDALVVLFIVPSPSKPGAMGNPSGKPALQVYIEKETLRVLGSHFVR